MKVIKLVTRDEFVIEDGEAESIVSLLDGHAGDFVRLKAGQVVRLSAISLIDEVRPKPYWSVYPVYQAGPAGPSYIIKEGQKLWLDYKGLQEITYKDKDGQPVALEAPKAENLIGTGQLPSPVDTPKVTGPSIDEVYPLFDSFKQIREISPLPVPPRKTLSVGQILAQRPTVE